MLEQTEAGIRHDTGNEPLHIPADVKTAAEAAQMVATLPAVDDPWIAREIALHAALYWEALAGKVANNTSHVLLQPVRSDDLPAMTMNNREFYLRVLAAMNDVENPIAWTTVEPPGELEAEYFPGTGELATRLSFSIIRRDDKAAVVTAEVSDTTGHTGSSRQRVIATFDGIDWSTRREGARLIW